MREGPADAGPFFYLASSDSRAAIGCYSLAMSFSLFAHGTLSLGILFLLIARLTHSGLGSCGPYGPMGLLIFLVPLLMWSGMLLVATYWIRRALRS